MPVEWLYLTNDNVAGDPEDRLIVFDDTGGSTWSEKVVRLPLPPGSWPGEKFVLAQAKLRYVVIGSRAAELADARLRFAWCWPMYTTANMDAETKRLIATRRVLDKYILEASQVLQPDMSTVAIKETYLHLARAIPIDKVLLDRGRYVARLTDATMDAIVGRWSDHLLLT